MTYRDLSTALPEVHATLRIPRLHGSSSFGGDGDREQATLLLLSKVLKGKG